MYLTKAMHYSFSKIWQRLLFVYVYYVKALEEDENYENLLFKSIAELNAISEEGKSVLKENFYCLTDDSLGGAVTVDKIKQFIEDVKNSYQIEKEERKNVKSGLTDFVLCGGALEGHNLKKEVNFSDAVILNENLCRITGNRNGMKWSTINAHGWFSYELKVKKNATNKIKVLIGSNAEELDVKITIDGKSKEIHEKIQERKWLTFNYDNINNDQVEIRFDKISANVPLIYLIVVE